MLQPKEVQIKTQDGGEKTFVLSKFPAIAGREIIAKYPLSALPKLGDYGVSEETMLKLMAYVAVPREDGTALQLTTRALVDNHVDSWETLGRIEMAMLEYNCSFFANGVASTFFEAVAQKVPTLVSRMLTDLQAQSSRPAKPASTS